MPYFSKVIPVVYANVPEDFKQNRNMWNDAMTVGSVWLVVRNWEIRKEKGPKRE
jgi:hypothetical protein